LKVSQRGSLTKDPLFKEAASAHLKLLKASGCNFAFAGTPHLPFSPKELLRHPRVSMVHMTSSLPLGSALLEDGVFPSDPQVGCVDSAALPSTPGVNPQAITMAFATLVSRRMFDRFQKVWA